MTTKREKNSALKGICHTSAHVQKFDFFFDRTFFKVNMYVREILFHRPYEVCENSETDIEELFSQHFGFELKTVKKYDVLERRFSKRLETKAIWSTWKTRLQDEDRKLCIAADVDASWEKVRRKRPSHNINTINIR